MMVRHHQPADLAVLVVPLVAAGAAGAPVHRPLPPDAVRLPRRHPATGLRVTPPSRTALGLGPEGRRDHHRRDRSSCWSSLAAAALLSARVLREYERGVCFRLGRLRPLAGPGLVFLMPFVDRLIRVDLRTVTLTIPPQEVITRDNVPARVNAVAYFRVVEPELAITEVEAYPVATSQIAQTTLRSVLGRAELDTLLSERDELNDSLRRIIDEQTEPWGIKVTTVEIKDVEIPEAMQRAMARAAEAERERRAKIISAEGEFQASQKLSRPRRSSAATPPRCSCATSRPWSSSAARSPRSCSPCRWTSSRRSSPPPSRSRTPVSRPGCAGGSRTGRLAEGLQRLQPNNAPVMSVLLLVIGLTLLGKGIGGLGVSREAHPAKVETRPPRTIHTAQMLIRFFCAWPCSPAPSVSRPGCCPTSRSRAAVFTYLWIALLFALVNAILGPILHLLALPITVLTLGLFALVVNAALLGLTALLSPDFQIDGFFTAVIAALLISVFSWLINLFVRD